MLCTTCTGLLLDLIRRLFDKSPVIPPPEPSPHHASMQSLRSAAADGCLVCSRVVSGMDTSASSEATRTCIELVDPMWRDQPDTSSQSDTRWSSDGDDPHGYPAGDEPYSCKLWVYPDAGQPMLIDHISVRGHEDIEIIARSRTAPLEQSTWSDEAVDTAKGWMNTCLNEHAACRLNGCAGTWYPTRLLDLCPSNAAGEGRIRLILTAETEIRSRPYMALSHRWGSGEFMKLERSTRTELHEGVGLYQLPCTLKDAVTVCRRLSVRYLWIDSLCIMQDSDDNADWLRESTTMHKVYTNAYLNISAIAAHDSSDGFIRDRDPRPLQPHDVEVNASSIGSVAFLWTNLWTAGTESVEHAPLNRRAWVMQERMLSPRVLHFGAEQLMWECRGLEAMEIYQQGRPPDLHRYSRHRELRNFKDLDPHHFGATSFKKSPDLGYHEDLTSASMMWHRIVVAYTGCELTWPSDKLVAIAGIAQYFSNLCDNNKYVAGMWRQHLEHDMQWQPIETLTFSPGGLHRRQAFYRAPSFSWASMDGSISFGNLSGYDRLITVLDVNLDHGSGDSAGHVRGGYLMLQCRIAKTRLSVSPNADLDWILYSSYTWLLEIDGTPWGLQDDNVIIQGGIDDGLDMESLTTSTPRTAFCVPTFLREGADESSLRMLLFELVDEHEGVYKRVGWASCRCNMFTDRPQTPLLPRLLEGDRDAPVAGHSDGMEVIKII